MTRVSKSIFSFGLYSLAMGTVLLFLSNLVLPLFNLPVTGQPWLNLLGFVLICSSYYYIRSALSGNMQFALFTTHTRFAAPLVVAYLIATGKADWHFVSFGIVDGLGAIWTWYEIRKANKSI